MNYLDALEAELTTVGIPSGRRRRILTEFADHLQENPNAELGTPRELALQFADELGTRLARDTAFRAFGTLAFAGGALAVMFLAIGRVRELTINGNGHTPMPAWAAPLLLVAVAAGQVSLAAGGLALLRAWRLRGERVINRTDATILARRSAVGIAGGAIALLSLPICALAFRSQAGTAWTTAAWILAAVGLAGIVAVVPTLLAGIRLRPNLDGRRRDLIDDLGPWVPSSLTPRRCALLVAAAIIVVLTVSGILTSDPYDGFARGLVNAVACMIGFSVLGTYLGLRTTS